MDKNNELYLKGFKLGVGVMLLFPITGFFIFNEGYSVLARAIIWIVIWASTIYWMRKGSK